MYKMECKKNGKIEFLRFIFSVIILLHHSRKFLGDDKCLFLGGSLAVEFFFIVSGFLMMQSITKIRIQCSASTSQTLGSETRNFILRKIKAVYPEVIIAWIISFLVVSFSLSFNIVECIKRLMLSSYEVIFVDMFGIGSGITNGVTWYISSMLMCMVVLYPLLRKYPDFSLNVIIPFSMLIAYGYLFQNFSNPRNPKAWLAITFKGNIRAYANICIGILSYQLCDHIKRIDWNIISRFLITMFEICIYAFIIWYMQFQEASDYDFFCCVLMAFAICLTFSGKSLDLKIYNSPVFFFLGKFSLCLYLSHTYYANASCFIFAESMTDMEKTVNYILCAVITAIVVFIVSSIVKQNKNTIVKCIKACLIKQ